MEASALRAPGAIATRRPAGGVLLRLRSDEQLVALFRLGNEDAFRIIHDRYRQRLSAYARQMLGGSATDADDAMQDVFLRAYGALRADDRPITLRAWLYRVAHNRCIDHLRRPASQPTVELSEEARPLPATTGDPIVAAERREDLRRLVVDVRALPEQQRSALLMREMEGLTYQELAGALCVTVPAVKSLLVRARMGLVESQQARDTPCLEIREDIAAAHDRGVRASGRTRRHVRECAGCAGYRTTLKGITADLGALSPVAGPWGLLAKLIGLGAGGSGAAGGAAAAGSGAAVGAGGTVAAGAGASAVVTKIAAVVASAAVLGGGVEVAREQTGIGKRSGAAEATTPQAVGRSAAARAGAPAGALHAVAGVPIRVFGDGTRATVADRRAAAKRAALRRAALAGGSATTTVVDPSTAASLPPAAAFVEVLPGDGGADGPLEDDGTVPSGAGSSAGTGEPVATHESGTAGTAGTSAAGSDSETGTGTGGATGSDTASGAPATSSGSVSASAADGPPSGSGSGGTAAPQEPSSSAGAGSIPPR